MTRLVLVAYAPTIGMRDAVFGDRSAPDLREVEPLPGRTASWVCGPEPAADATMRQLGGGGPVLDGLAGPDCGSWTGRTLDEVGQAEPEGLRSWLIDPYATPHGGESLAGLVVRVGAVLDGLSWPPGRAVVVAHPLAVRAAVVHALGAAPEVLFRLDVAPLARVGISGAAGSWRLGWRSDRSR